ncbi:hypothetical protein BIW11_08460, partial [Tropilaelaps mercedesae]
GANQQQTGTATTQQQSTASSLLGGLLGGGGNNQNASQTTGGGTTSTGSSLLGSLTGGLLGGSAQQQQQQQKQQQQQQQQQQHQQQMNVMNQQGFSGIMGPQQGMLGGPNMVSGQMNQGGMMTGGSSAMLGPNGQPLVGPNGQPILGPNGQPLQQQGGMQPLLGPNGQPLLGPNGQPLLGPIQPGQQQMGQFGVAMQQSFGNVQQQSGMNNPTLGQQSYGYGPTGPGMAGPAVIGVMGQGPIPSTNDPYDPYGKRPENQLAAQQQRQGNSTGVNADGSNWIQTQNWQTTNDHDDIMAPIMGTGQQGKQANQGAREYKAHPQQQQVPDQLLPEQQQPIQKSCGRPSRRRPAAETDERLSFGNNEQELRRVLLLEMELEEKDVEDSLADSDASEDLVDEVGLRLCLNYLNRLPGSYKQPQQVCFQQSQLGNVAAQLQGSLAAGEDALEVYTIPEEADEESAGLSGVALAADLDVLNSDTAQSLLRWRGRPRRPDLRTFRNPVMMVL